MKKNFLFTMFVMLMTSISSFAQKEYNMVITLSNGTTVTTTSRRLHSTMEMLPYREIWSTLSTAWHK